MAALSPAALLVVGLVNLGPVDSTREYLGHGVHPLRLLPGPHGNTLRLARSLSVIEHSHCALVPPPGTHEYLVQLGMPRRGYGAASHGKVYQLLKGIRGEKPEPPPSHTPPVVPPSRA